VLLLEALVKGLEAWLPAEADKEKAPVVVDRKILLSVCENLARLLARDNPEAGDLLDANADLLRAAFGDGYREIENATREFNFEPALQLLRQRSQVLGMDL
jgi:two-component system sensor histidine kinase/response regulator